MSTAVEKKKVFNVDSFLKTLESTNGRDKLGKLIQYVARLSAWYLSRYNPSDKASIAQAAGVQKGVASARKLTRLLKWWPLLIKLWDAIVKKGFNQSLVEHLRNISSFGMANYFFWDNMSWAVGVGLIKGDNAKFSKWSMYGWFFGLVFAVIIDTLDLKKAVTQACDKKDGENKNSCSLVCNPICKKFTLNYAKNLSDLTIAAKGVQLIDPSEGILGVCGIVAALVGFYELWPAQ